MLDQIDLNKKLSKKELKKQMEKLEPKLGRLQRELRAAGIPTMIVFEGFGASGKGHQIGRLIRALDPRGFAVYPIGKETEEDRMHPFLWRYWTKLPAKGQIAIFDRSWYRRVLIDRFDGATPETKIGEAFREIRDFEHLLAEDGTLIIKLFLCIDRKEQKKRFEKLRSDPATAWRVTKDDLKRNRHFDEYKNMNDEMLEATDTDDAPWFLVEAMDREYATLKIYTAVIAVMQAALDESGSSAGNVKKDEKEAVSGSGVSSVRGRQSLRVREKHAEEDAGGSILSASGLDKADLSLKLSRRVYRDELKKLQDRIAELHGELYRRRIPAVIGFEGWDAAGKGGAILRLTEKMDPRGYRVNPTAAPNDYEKVHHYLWRFWRNMPKDGHIAIFDRTWYGRVMVERIEHFCTDAEWQRAYQEINEMERELHTHGAVVLKFWMQISKDEQEKRFKERMADPEKRWKITDEDWRNREKWELYETAINEMLVRTSTTYAPWIIVEGNDKYYARVKVLRTVVSALEKRLEEK